MSKKLPAGLDRAKLCAEIAAELMGKEIMIMDMRPLMKWADFMVLINGASKRQNVAIADAIIDKMAALGDKKRSVEGYQEGSWVVIDFGDIVVHLFTSEKRDYYQLEHLWADAPRVDWQPAEVA